MAFEGKPPGSGAGDISRQTEALRPVLLLTPREAMEKPLDELLRLRAAAPRKPGRRDEGLPLLEGLEVGGKSGS